MACRRRTEATGARCPPGRHYFTLFYAAPTMCTLACGSPPGTSKWNKIEHRLFCHITQNWRGRPLESRTAVVELITATTTKTGLKVECVLDERTYEKGIKVSDAEMDALDIRGDTFHPGRVSRRDCTSGFSQNSA